MTLDVIVVGAGHNGLVAAGYLARAGLTVHVLEADEVVGGPAGVREFIPGYRTSVTNSPGSFEPQIVADLELMDHGLAFHRVDPTLVQPLGDDRFFIGYRDRERTNAQLEEFAEGESTRYTELFDYLQDFADRVGISLFGPPPTLTELVRNLTSPDDQADFARLLWGSASELVRRHLRSAEARTIVTTLATAGGPGSPSIPGTCMNLLMRPLSLAGAALAEGYDPRRSPLRGSTGLPIGGMGRITEAIASYIRSKGGVVETGQRVERIRTRDGRAVGVTTQDGRDIDARIIISAVDPKTTVMQFMANERDWDIFREQVVPANNVEGACKVTLAVEGLPRWFADGAPMPEQYSFAQFRVATSEQYLEDAYAACLAGEIPSAPVIFGLIPSATSPGMAPEGHHVLSLNLNAPRRLARGTWCERASEMTEATIATLERWMPDLRSRIVDSHCVTPDDFVSQFGLVDAEISHGEMLPGSLFWMRPLPGLAGYRTPTPGLYLSGAGTWPGNYVSGVPGLNTANVVLADLSGGTK